MKLKILIFLLGFLLLIPIMPIEAVVAANNLKGRILLQVESKGEAWYVDTAHGARISLGKPDDMFQLMRSIGLGIKQTELRQYLEDSFPERLAGKILLNVEEKGEAYYISPDDLKGYYLGSPSKAFQVIKEKALGITNANLNKIEISSSTSNISVLVSTSTPVVLPVPVSTSTSAITSIINIATTTSIIPTISIITPTLVPTSTCSVFTYSSWSACVNNQQTRTVTLSLPVNCIGGQPEITRSCDSAVCSSWHYSGWHNCSGGYQYREILESFPADCIGGEPALMKNCSTNVICSSWNYNAWSPCSAVGLQTRTVLDSFPDGCSDGQPVLSQSCIASSTSQYSPYQFSYVREMGPAYDPDVRILFLSPANDNIKIIKIPMTAYYGYSFYDPLPADLELSVNYILGDQFKTITMTRLDNKNYIFDGDPIPLNLGDHNSVTIKANKSGYSAVNDDMREWIVWDYSTNKQVWTGN